MGLLLIAGVHLLQWIASFLTLDIFFRTMPVDPAAFRRQIAGYRFRFTLVAVAFALAGAASQVWAAGVWGGALGLMGWVPWWMLWRFGWRKQFTYLYKDDGGRDHAATERPGP